MANPWCQVQSGNSSLSHSVHKRFGVVLPHKHLDIEPTERLVGYGHASVPWEVGITTSHVIDEYEGIILPRSFRLMEGSFVPYEFEYFHESRTQLSWGKGIAAPLPRSTTSCRLDASSHGNGRVSLRVPIHTLRRKTISRR